MDIGNNNTFNYEMLTEKALTQVVKLALLEAEVIGIPAPHAFYISFLTKHPKVQMPAFLHAKYNEEITIVLQYEFSNLKVSDEEFGVTLSFDGRPYYIIVPFEAITTFMDPSRNFALQFPSSRKALEEKLASSEEEKQPTLPYNSEKIVSLDSYRKKKS